MKSNKLLLFICLFVFSSYTFKDIDLKAYWSNLIRQYGLKQSEQSFCFRVDGIVSGENINKKIKPASVTKLYTTLWSLDKLSKDHRFQTQIRVVGSDLYIVGGEDPYFVTENLFLLMNKLAELGMTKFDKVYFSKDFYLNWSDTEIAIINNLTKILNTAQWPKEVDQSYQELLEYIKRNRIDLNLSLKAFEVGEVILANTKAPEKVDFSFIHKSSPLWMHLKQVNMYSNNFYTDHLFNYLGGEAEFSQYINSKLLVSKNEIHFITGSGLGDNYTTCKTTLLMLDSLETILKSQNLLPSDIIAVPGVDEGTLKHRFTESHYNRKLVAKTGTLNDTSSLAGYIYSKDNLDYFAVFNHTDAYADKKYIREMQNDFVKESIDLIGTMTTIQYQSPDYNSILDTQIIE